MLWLLWQNQIEILGGVDMVGIWVQEGLRGLIFEVEFRGYDIFIMEEVSWGLFRCGDIVRVKVLGLGVGDYQRNGENFIRGEGEV